MKSMQSVLWIGDGEHFAADEVGREPFLDVIWERSARAAARLPLAEFDAVVLDAPAADEALEDLAHLRAAAVPVLVRLDPGDLHRRPELERAGATDVIARSDTDPVGRELLAHIERLGQQRPCPAPPDAPPKPALPGIVGQGPEMQEVFELVRFAARSQATVLISGETGTGKELVARALHRISPRCKAPFLAINCAAFPDTLLESELFGHLRGSFTGAERDRAGLFEEAQGGSLFLDEVGETSPAFQAKLLRVLQEREVRRLGCSRSRPIDVRVIAASNRDLLEEARSGTFRSDLYYRLGVFPIQLPPLRRRIGDLRALAEHFLALHARRENRGGCDLGADALRLLETYAWPGNVRELENEIQRALTLVDAGATLGPEHFSPRLRESLAPVSASRGGCETLRESLDRLEAWLIRRALARNEGRRALTARQLGITREGLYKKMKRFRIQ